MSCSPRGRSEQTISIQTLVYTNLNCPHVHFTNNSSCWWKFKNKFDHREEVDVGVVQGKINYKKAGCP